MQTQLKVKVIRRKESHPVTAMDELQHLMDFNQSISLAMPKTMQHLSNFVFISMANITLARRDSYLNHLRSGIKQDTLNTLRTAPLWVATLFPESPFKGRANIAQYEN